MKKTELRKIPTAKLLTLKRNPQYQTPAQMNSLKDSIRRIEDGSDFKWPTYDSIGQCASHSKVPILVLKEAKKLGCPAFRNTRIYFEEFIPWLFTTMMSDSSVNWSQESKKLDVLLKRVDLAVKEDRVIDRNTVADGIAKSVGIMFGDLDRVFTSELPTRGKGMDELTLRKLALTEIEKIKDSMRRKLKFISVEKIKANRTN